MGKYTVLDVPIVDQTIDAHIHQIVAAIRAKVDPQSLILRGSFGRGEGSVRVEGRDVHFLSDYELAIVMPQRQYQMERRWLHTTVRTLSNQIGVETSISRYSPSSLSAEKIAHPTVSMYEIQNGGIVLYGEDILPHRSAIDPRALDTWDGLRLMLNRMAESLPYATQTNKDWYTLYWINKIILSCAEALLIAHHEYHFSYAERGRRFADLVPELDTVTERANALPTLVARATDFKLRPSFDLYAEPLSQIWQQVRQVCDSTLRYVIEKYLSFSFDTYAEFPKLYLSQLQAHNKLGKSWLSPLPAPLSQNLFLVLRLLRDRRLPAVKLITRTTYPAYQIVFSVIPLLFLSDGADRALRQEVRHWLAQVYRIKASVADDEAAWTYLRACAVQAWKDFCYGMWSVIS
ncbi:MAG: hypothetical protein JXA33_07565 [Anaerolineae bacterium]|nr:hypothetical protein [Anaerolineae bacterium]